MAMGLEVSLVPFSSVVNVPGVALGASLGLGAKCDGLGALPLPLERDDNIFKLDMTCIMSYNMIYMYYMYYSIVTNDKYVVHKRNTGIQACLSLLWPLSRCV